MAGLGHIGPYELRGELGRGAMARVWRAWDPGLRREVAIKEPLFDARLSQDTLNEMARRFVAEGRAAARLHHPNIVGVYATDVWDSRPAIVMELVEGITLTHLLSRGPLAQGEALGLLDQLLDAVAYAHERGVIHRDIKPDNIFVTPEGVVKLADFGIAHLEGPEVTRLTMAGSVLGTPGYMSPEQAQGRPVDARSDLFSIGAVAYEMLAGENPFSAGAPDATTLIYRIVHEPAPDLQIRLSAEASPMARATMAALEKDPTRRPATATELKALLHGGSLPEPSAAGQASRTTALELEEVPQVARGRDPHEGQGSGPARWLPYVAVAVVCTVGLVVALLSASGGGGGGGVSAGVAEEGDARVESPAQGEGEDDAGTDDAATSEGAAAEVPDEPQTGGFSESDAPYTLTVDDGRLALYDASGRRMDDAHDHYLDVSCLPEKAVALLERGISYDSYEEARYEYDTTDDDCVPPVAPSLPQSLPPESVSDEGPYWCVVVGVYAFAEEAERVAAASAEKFGVEVSVLRTLEWAGLFYGHLQDEATDHGDGYCVVTGLSGSYQEVLERYLGLSEVLGQQLDPQLVAALKDGSNLGLLDELSEIEYAGTRRYPEG